MSVFSTPAHKQTEEAKLPGQVVNPVGNPAKAPGVIRNDITLADYIARKTPPGPSEYDKGWNAALAAVDAYLDVLYIKDIYDDFEAGQVLALDKVTQFLDKEKK